MKKQRALIFVVVAIYQILAVIRGQAADLRTDSTMHTLLLKGLQEVHIEAYDSAIGTFQKLTDHYPRHPVGYFCTAAVYKTIMQNYRVKTFEPKLDQYLDLAIQAGQNGTQNDGNDATVSFYKGGAYGFRGLHKVRKRDWWGALKDGLKGLSLLKRALEMDSSLYDTYYGMGSYHYWRSAKFKLLRILFFRNDKARGIREIWTAIDKGKYTGIEGKYTLVAIYYDQEDYEKAFSLNQELYALFPTNPSCVYMRGRLLMKRWEWDEAKNAMEILLSHLKNVEYRSLGYELECHYWIASCCYHLGQLDETLQHTQEALSLRNQLDGSKELEGPLEDNDEIFAMVGRLHEVLLKKLDMQKAD
jgi:tetratricopeptide (TPR) repeat protein